MQKFIKMNNKLIARISMVNFSRHLYYSSVQQTNNIPHLIQPCFYWQSLLAKLLNMWHYKSAISNPSLLTLATLGDSTNPICVSRKPRLIGISKTSVIMLMWLQTNFVNLNCLLWHYWQKNNLISLFEKKKDMINSLVLFNFFCFRRKKIQCQVLLWSL
jgi:hypothetical protein